MKHIVIFLNFICLIFACSFFSCEDNRELNIPNDKIYLLKQGINEQNVFNWPDFTYELVVVKSGIGKQGGKLQLNVKPELLVKYNDSLHTNYELLPEEMYTIKNNPIDVTSGDYRFAFNIGMEVDEIASLQNNTGAVYALPCQISGISGSFDMGEDDKLISIIVPRITDPYIEMKESGLRAGSITINNESADKTVVYVDVKTNFNNDKWDIDFTVETPESLVDQYNAGTSGIDYVFLKEAAYQIDPASLKIPKNFNEWSIKITILKEGFLDNNGNYSAGNYLIPIRISSVGKDFIGINSQKDYLLIPVSFTVI